jgi:hypothetical protein
VACSSGQRRCGWPGGGWPPDSVRGERHAAWREGVGERLLRMTILLTGARAWVSFFTCGSEPHLPHESVGADAGFIFTRG